MSIGTTSLCFVESENDQVLYAHNVSDQDHDHEDEHDTEHKSDHESHEGEKWVGVDHAIVEEVAQKADRPPQEPYINTAQGDLLLFVFLVAGVVAGALAGYYYAKLFGVKRGHDE